MIEERRSIASAACFPPSRAVAYRIRFFRTCHIVPAVLVLGSINPDEMAARSLCLKVLPYRLEGVAHLQTPWLGAKILGCRAGAAFIIVLSNNCICSKKQHVEYFFKKSISRQFMIQNRIDVVYLYNLYKINQNSEQRSC